MCWGTPVLFCTAYGLGGGGLVTGVAFLVARPLARRQAARLGIPARPPTGVPMQPDVPAPKR